MKERTIKIIKKLNLIGGLIMSPLMVLFMINFGYKIMFHHTINLGVLYLMVLILILEYVYIAYRSIIEIISNKHLKTDILNNRKTLNSLKEDVMYLKSLRQTILYSDLISEQELRPEIYSLDNAIEYMKTEIEAIEKSVEKVN